MNMDFKRKLPIPMETKELYPMTAQLSEIRDKKVIEIKKVLSGEDDRKILVIGPCSADNEDSVLEYTTRLAKVAEKVEDKLLIIPRVYTNKPRTTGDGYKGLLHQPNPEDEPDLFKGIVAIRKMHMRVLQETGLPTADEMLYPENHRYLSDVLAYVAVGARSVENQQHRLVASGLDIPVGMKNPTGGDISVMMNAITAAHHKHMFVYRGWEVESQGNPYAHAIMRGYVDARGVAMPNYHYEQLAELCNVYNTKDELVNKAIIVDTNHSNSNKKYAEQPRIAKQVLHSCRHNADINKMVKGFMIESYIEEGCQKIGEGVFGKSITDPCLGWDASEKLIYDLAELL